MIFVNKNFNAGDYFCQTCLKRKLKQDTLTNKKFAYTKFDLHKQIKKLITLFCLYV